MPEFDFILEFDPGPYPLESGLRLSILEVMYGLRLGSFNPGTRLFDKERGILYTVCQADERLYLGPVCRRLV